MPADLPAQMDCKENCGWMEFYLAPLCEGGARLKHWQINQGIKMPICLAIYLISVQTHHCTCTFRGG